jgi:hypothetical protein
MIDVSGTYNQVAGVVELDTSSAIVDGGWVVGQQAALYAYRTNTITGNLSNAGLLEFGPMTSPPDQPWNDSLAVNGDFGQSSTGQLTMDVGNSNTDTLHVSNHAGLGGGLTVRTPPSFFGFGVRDLIFYQTRTGTFSSTGLPSGWVGEYIDNLPDGPGWFRIRRQFP